MNKNSFVIQTTNLTKAYGKSGQTKDVVNKVNLAVPQGCIYGFLGPNGAGKSTTMKMLLGLIKPTGGEISILGTPFVSQGKTALNEKSRLTILKQTGSLIESPSYYGHLTGRENLEIICTLKNVPTKEISQVLSIVRMENQQDKKVGHYSLGMKQRLGLASALLGHPKLLLLDEPTNGLDPAGIQEMRELIRSLPENYHMTIMVSSHLLSEIDQMADYVGIINKGQLIFQDSLLRLHTHSKKQLRLRTGNNNRALCVLNENKINCTMDKDFLLFPETSDDETARLISALVQEGISVLRIEEYQKSLEDIFLSLTGKQVSL
ncbi:ATP-binding cassette domain-containing protein [Parablautia muri]|uniref:ATP-binding cassette domain-containing protein n=1 Tax=Parablautia muri TaxID=2320879 RepID=A0A9X5GTA6_9FIRM|nr:ATP-binding cassette domain-containing protein [Parablautia muri]NBJ92787.1 ATP-binding cassette domain-containing protein [Parablautia muri]